jgi:hypothetical protein
MDECNQTNSLLDISCIHTHVLRFEHLIEHVGSLLGEEKKGESFWTYKPLFQEMYNF